MKLKAARQLSLHVGVLFPATELLVHKHAHAKGSKEEWTTRYGDKTSL